MLEKCKFCGNVPTFKESYVRDDYFIGRKHFNGYYLHCDRCGYKTEPGKTYEKAAEIWDGENKGVRND